MNCGIEDAIREGSMNWIGAAFESVQENFVDNAFNVLLNHRVNNRDKTNGKEVLGSNKQEWGEAHPDSYQGITIQNVVVEERERSPHT
jgi:hypothetical protein